MSNTLISGDYFDLGFDPATAFPDDYAEAQQDIYDQGSSVHRLILDIK